MYNRDACRLSDMQWFDYRLPIRPATDQTPALPSSELHRQIWERWARIHMGNRLRGRAYTGIFSGGYIDSQASGGFAVGKWNHSDGALWFRFPDGDGLFTSAAMASAHFTEVSVATLLEDDNFSRTMKHVGWLLEPLRDASTALNNSLTPLIDLRGVLYVIVSPSSTGAAPQLLSDARLPKLAFSELTSVEQGAVIAAADQHRCACLLCEYYRPRIAKLVEKRALNTARSEQLSTTAKPAKTARAKKS